MRLLPFEHPEDLERLPGEVLLSVLDELVKIGREPERGKALWYQPAMGGDLTGCRSVIVKGAWRIVYMVREEGIEVVAIGYRGRGDGWRGVYVEAVERRGGVPRTKKSAKAYLQVRHHDPAALEEHRSRCQSRLQRKDSHVWS